MLKKVLAILLVVATICSLAACGKKDSETYDDYSIGLDANGFYETLSDNEKNVSASNIKIKTEEIIAWGAKQLETKDTSVDEYVKDFTREILVNIGAANKEVAAEGDLATLQLDFYLDGKQLKEFYGTNTFSVSAESDELIKSVIGHKMNDEYETQYTFPADDVDYPSKTATVKVKVVEVLYGDPLTEDIVKAHLEEINKVVDNVTDVASLLKNIRPNVAKALLFDYISEYIQNDGSVEVPQEYVDYELYRLKARLQKVEYTYEDYLEASKVTHEDTLKECEKFARENFFIMLYAKQNNLEVKNDYIDMYYGDSKETGVNVQGLPYMKLTVLRELAIYKMMSEVTLLDDEGNKIEIEDVNPFDEALKNSTEKPTDNAEGTTNTDKNKDAEGSKTETSSNSN